MTTSCFYQGSDRGMAILSRNALYEELEIANAQIINLSTRLTTLNGRTVLEFDPAKKTEQLEKIKLISKLMTNTAAQASCKSELEAIFKEIFNQANLPNDSLADLVESPVTRN